MVYSNYKFTFTTHYQDKLRLMSRLIVSNMAKEAPERHTQPQPAVDSSSETLSQHAATLAAEQNHRRPDGGVKGRSVEPTALSMNGRGDMSTLYGSHAPLEGGRDKVYDGASTSAASPIEQSRDRLTAVLEQRFHNDPHGADRMADVRRDITDFERRMGTSPHSSEQIARTYDQMTEMVNARQSVMPQGQRTEIATQLLHAAAHPDAVRQGWSTTCEAASLETRLLTSEPASVAGLMRQMCTTGSYDTTDGLHVTLDRGTLLHNQHGIIPPQFASAGIGERNQMDQVFQATLRNVELADINHSNPGTHLSYRLGPVNAQHPMGEYVTNSAPGLSREERDLTAQYQGMSSFDVSDIYRKVSGQYDPSVRVSSVHDITNPDNAHDFTRMMEEARRTGGFPATVAVNTNQEPFRSDMHVPAGQGVMHAITVTGIDERGNLEYRNSYFGERRFTISPDKLLDATHAVVGREDLKLVADAINNNHLTDHQMHEVVLRTAYETAPSQRAQVLADLSRATQRNLGAVLTNDERERLGMGRDMFERIGHSLGFDR